MSRSLTSRLAALAITVVTTVAMLGVSFDAEAQRRMGSGSNVGRQSSNVTQMRAPATPPAANAARTPQGQPATAAAATAGAGAAAAGARSGASRWLGPIAGIAAGLGLAALFSHLGLGGALAEFLGSMLLIAIVAFAVIFLVRRLMAGRRQPATLQAAAGAAPMQRSTTPNAQANLTQRTMAQPAPAQAAVHPAVAATAAPANVPADGNWHIPAGFDTQGFLKNAKQHFIALQGAWDRNDVAEMREYMTDELLEALRAQLAERTPGGKTEVILLNAEMLGIENIEQGNLASVRFSGMLKDGSGPEAYRFEEVWHFLKPVNAGWLLAGIQQIPVEYEA